MAEEVLSGHSNPNPPLAKTADKEGLFTESQAKACKITSVNKFKSGSNYTWNVGLNDAEGTYYSVLIEGLSKDSVKADIKAAVIITLQTMKKIDSTSVIEPEDIDDNFDAGIGETLA